MYHFFYYTSYHQAVKKLYTEKEKKNFVLINNFILSILKSYLGILVLAAQEKSFNMQDMKQNSNMSMGKLKALLAENAHA
jgi:hypothetical protein